MVRQILLMTGLVVGASVFADNHRSVATPNVPLQVVKVSGIRDLAVAQDAKINYGQAKSNRMQKAPATVAQWKRPAGQFWGTGYDTSTDSWTYLTPLMLRPWVDYTFENVSKGVSGQPTWQTEVLVNPDTGEYQTVESHDSDVKASYLRYELCAAPRLSYNGAITYPTQFDGLNESPEPFNDIMVLADNSAENMLGMNILVNSHFWGIFTREPQDSPYTYIRGAAAYPNMDYGMWFGTNADGFNAMATRFEKPDSPYLLNAVEWFYFSSGPIPANIPLTAYVFKTASDDAEYSNGFLGAELGDLIAVSDSFIPSSDDIAEGCVRFEFKEKNPVTGAETGVSLEIEDDIIIVVTGYDANPGNGTWISTVASTDTIDEGYGNLGFFGALDFAEDGTLQYFLYAIESVFDGLVGNTTLGVLADVSYPWLIPYFYEQEKDIWLPNDGETTEEVQGLEYNLLLMSTSETADFEVTFNGEEECDWLAITDVYDQIEDEEFTGVVGLAFTAAPNPEDVDRTCVVKISIPAASYTVTFRQGTNNNAVEIVGVDGNAQYFDLQGRRVANPDKGIYIKKSGNKATKVIF